jgi:D-sedoheptulose 7-phosphate isomerase
MKKSKTHIHAALKASRALKKTLLNDETFQINVNVAASTISERLRLGKKILIAGNGGSQSDAQHFAGELIGSFSHVSRNGLHVLSFPTNLAFATAWGNDVHYNDLFRREVEAHGKDGDVLVVISTSGNSKNLILAAEEAKKRRIRVIGLLGRDGGALAPLCDIALIVPSQETPRIQEVHILMIHAICAQVEGAPIE